MNKEQLQNSPSFKQKIMRLEQNFKQAYMSKGQPLSYCLAFIKYINNHQFGNPEEDYKFKMYSYADQINLLKLGQSFPQVIKKFINERQLIIRHLRSQLISNRHNKQINLADTCQQLQKIRMCALMIIQKVNACQKKLKINHSPYFSQILQKLGQDVDFLRLSGLRKYIQFSNQNDPLFIFPLKKFWSLQFVTDCHKKPIIDLFTLDLQYQKRLQSAEYILKNFENYETDQIINQSEARRIIQKVIDQSNKNKNQVKNCYSTLDKFTLPTLVSKQEPYTSQLKKKNMVSNLIKEVVADYKANNKQKGIKEYFQKNKKKMNSIFQPKKQERLQFVNNNERYKMPSTQQLKSYKHQRSYSYIPQQQGNKNNNIDLGRLSRLRKQQQREISSKIQSQVKSKQLSGKIRFNQFRNSHVYTQPSQKKYEYEQSLPNRVQSVKNQRAGSIRKNNTKILKSQSASPIRNESDLTVSPQLITNHYQKSQGRSNRCQISKQYNYHQFINTSKASSDILKNQITKDQINIQRNAIGKINQPNSQSISLKTKRYQSQGLKIIENERKNINVTPHQIKNEARKTQIPSRQFKKEQLSQKHKFDRIEQQIETENDKSQRTIINNSNKIQPKVNQQVKGQIGIEIKKIKEFANMVQKINQKRQKQKNINDKSRSQNQEDIIQNQKERKKQVINQQEKEKIARVIKSQKDEFKERQRLQNDEKKGKGIKVEDNKLKQEQNRGVKQQQSKGIKVEDNKLKQEQNRGVKQQQSKGIKVEDNKLKQEQNRGVKQQQSKGIKVEDNKLKQEQNRGVKQQQSKGIKVEDNKLKQEQNRGVKQQQSKGIKVEDNKLKQEQNRGVKQQQSKGIKVEDNKLKQEQNRGVKQQQSKGIKVEDNKLKQEQNRGVKQQQSKGIKVEDNKLKQEQNRGVKQQQSKGIKVEDNKLKQEQNRGVKQQQSKGIKVEDNKLKQEQNRGVKQQQSKGIKVEDNKLKQESNRGVKQQQSKGIKVEDNKLKQESNRGVKQQQSKGIKVEDNKLKQEQNRGVKQQQSKGIKVEDNKLKQEQNRGVKQQQSKGIKVEDNKLKQEQNRGVKQQQSKGIKVEDNKLKQEQNRGVKQQQSKGIKVEDNKLKQEQNRGVKQQQSKGIKVEDNKLKQEQNRGVKQQQSKGIKVEDNKLKQEQNRGVKQQQSKGIKVEDNKLKQEQNRGVKQQQSKGIKVEDNKLKQEQNRGVKQQQSKGIKVEDNKLKQEQNRGVKQQQSKGIKVEDNKLKQESNRGVKQQQSKGIKVEDNKLKQEQNRGVKQQQSKGIKVEDNKLKQEQNRGVKQQQSKGIKVEDNKLKQEQNRGVKQQQSKGIKVEDNKLKQEQNRGVKQQQSKGIKVEDNKLKQEQNRGVKQQQSKGIKVEDNKLKQEQNRGVKQQQSKGIKVEDNKLKQEQNRGVKQQQSKGIKVEDNKLKQESNSRIKQQQSQFLQLQNNKLPFKSTMSHSEFPINSTSLNLNQSQNQKLRLILQKCSFQSKQLLHQQFFKLIKSLSPSNSQHLLTFIEQDFLTYRQILLATCIFDNQICCFCIYHIQLYEQYRRVFILHVQIIGQKFQPLQLPFFNTFIKYIFINDPCQHIIYLNLKGLTNEKIIKELKNYKQQIQTPLKMQNIEPISFLLERKDIKCTKQEQFTSIITFTNLFAFNKENSRLSIPQKSIFSYQKNYLQKIEQKAKKEVKKFISSNQLNIYLQSQELPKFKKSKLPDQIYLAKHIIDDCLTRSKFFVFSKQFYFTVEFPYTCLYEGKQAFFLALATKGGKYFIFGDKLYEEEIDLTQAYKRQIQGKDFIQIFKNPKSNGKLVTCPTFKKEIEQPLAQAATLMTIELNWKDYLKGTRYLPQSSIDLQLVGQFFFGLIQLKEGNKIQLLCSTIIQESDALS